MAYSKWQINAVLSVVILFAGMGAVGVLAADSNTEYMKACQSELNQHYGEDMDISVVSKRRNPAGMEVKLAARLDEHNVEFLNCWVPSLSEAAQSFDQQADTYAVTVTPVEMID